MQTGTRGRLSAAFAALTLVALTGAGTIAAPPEGGRIVGSRDVKTEVRTVRGFDGVELFGLGDVSIEQGSRESLIIEAEDNILPLIVSRVERGTLRLGIERSNVQVQRPIRFRLTVRGLKRIKASGAGSISSGPLSSDRLDAEVSGAGRLRIERLDTDTLRLGLSGSGDAKIAGAAARQEVKISGAGEYDGRRFLTRETDLLVSGAGQARVHASAKFKAEVSGAGSVRFGGSPGKTDIKISGAGSVRPDERH